MYCYTEADKGRQNPVDSGAHVQTAHHCAVVANTAFPRSRIER